jgi:glycosyltransferase involved in cell wall biosynthesis
MPETLPNRDYADPDHTIIMFAGHFDPVRGIDRFLDVTAVLETEEIQFSISGTGREEEKQHVRDRVQRLDDARITYYGTLPWEEYRTRVISADILVNFQSPDAPISKYTFPSKLLDFMSAGKIVISTDISDLSEALGEELVIGGRTTDELVAAVSNTVERYRTADLETGHLARDWVEANCTHEYTGAQYGRVIRTAVSQ